MKLWTIFFPLAFLFIMAAGGAGWIDSNENICLFQANMMLSWRSYSFKFQFQILNFGFRRLEEYWRRCGSPKSILKERLKISTLRCLTMGADHLQTSVFMMLDAYSRLMYPAVVGSEGWTPMKWPDFTCLSQMIAKRNVELTVKGDWAIINGMKSVK